MAIEPHDSMIRAALLWDIPRLKLMDLPGRREFIEALSPPLWREPVELPEENIEAPLVAAARALQLDRLQERGEAELLCQSLIQLGGWPRLLGLFVLNWLPGREDKALFEETMREILAWRRSKIKAHLLLKLLTIALDRPYPEFVEQLYGAALSTSRPNTQLRAYLYAAGFNFLGLPIPSEGWGRYRPDPLVEYAWIEEELAKGARETLTREVRERAASPWSTTLRFGKRPVDQALAAEQQALWAGALWLLSDVRVQLGAELLLGGAEVAVQYGYAVQVWIDGSGRDIPRVIDFAEPHFEDTTLEQILEVLDARLLVRKAGWSRYIETALAGWDLLGTARAERLLEQVDPAAGEHPVLDQQRTLWAAMAIHAPERWEEKYRGLNVERRTGLLDVVTPGLATHLPEEAARDLLDLVVERLRGQPSSQAAVWRLFASLAERFDEQAMVTSLVEEAPVWVVGAIVQQDASAVPQDQLERAASELVAANERDLAEARRGRYALGTTNARAELARVIPAMAGDGSRYVRHLVDTAGSDDAPANIRLEALRGMAVIARHKGLASDLTADLANAPVGGVAAVMEDVSRDLLQAAIIQVMASASPKAVDASELFLLGRHPDARVRELVVSACGSMLGRGSEAIVEAVALSALFDPVERVVLAGLGAIATGPLRLDGTERALQSRLDALFREYGRDVRVQVANAARSRSGSASAASVLASASSDRSWRVRQAASQRWPSE
jgi:hypothetical protein